MDLKLWIKKQPQLVAVSELSLVRITLQTSCWS